MDILVFYINKVTNNAVHNLQPTDKKRTKGTRERDAKEGSLIFLGVGLSVI